MKEVLEYFMTRIDTGEDIALQLYFKTGHMFAGAVKRSEKFNGVYVLKTMIADRQGNVAGAIDIYFNPDDVSQIAAKEESKLTVPENAGKIIVPGR